MEQPSPHSFPLLLCLLPTGKRCQLPQTDPCSPARSAASFSGKEIKPGACGSPGVVGDPWQAPWMTGPCTGPSSGSSEAWSWWGRNTDRSRACLQPYSAQHLLLDRTREAAGIQTGMEDVCVCAHGCVCVWWCGMQTHPHVR